LGLAFFASVMTAAETPRKIFTLEAGDAVGTLKAFSEQSGEQIVYPVEQVRGVSTNRVRGELTPAAALDLMLANTGLVAKQDAATGDFAVSRSAPLPGPKETARADSTPTTRAESQQAIELDRFEVTGSRLKQTEVEGFSPVIAFEAAFIERSGFGTLSEFLQTLPQNYTGAATGRLGVPNDANPTLFTRSAGQSGVGLRGLGSNSTLVLIDGRRAPLSGKANPSTTPPQSFFDVNTIPFGMVERIEVLTDGASAIYGTDAIGGVINIILKKNYNRVEAKARFAGTTHGGGFERGATLTSGYNRGRIKATLVIDFFEREALLANQRWFSRDGDLRPRGGIDQRSTIGYPLTIFALPGQTLGGLTNPNGTPATQAVGPVGKDGRSLTVADFAAGAGQRAFYNSAALYALIPPTERQGLTATAEYQLYKPLRLFTELAFTHTRTESLGNPLSSSNPSGSAAAPRIPATNPYNPFRQILGFSISHEELGQRVALADTNSWRGVVGLRADLPNDWTAEGSLMYYGQKLLSSLPAVDNAALTAALNQTDPSKALNLFGDFYANGPTNPAGIYDAIVRTNTIRADSGIYTADAFARGSIWTLPGGPVQVAVGGSFEQQDRLRVTTAPSALDPLRSREVRDSTAGYLETSVPLFGKKNARPKLLLRALELQVAVRRENIEGAGGTTNPKYAFRWQPWSALLVRASYGTGFRAPALSEFERPNVDSNPTVTDRRRANERYPVRVVTGAFPNLEPETSKTWNYGFVLNVPKVKGLSFGTDFYWKEQRNLTANLSTQTLLDYESLFSERIIRLPATPTDTAAGFPGRITDVDARFSNFGRVLVQGYDVNATLQQSSEAWGRFTFRLAATCAKSYKIAFNPGDPLTERRGSFGFPQKWNGNGSVFWDRGRFGVSLFCYYQGPAVTNAGARTLGSFTVWNLGGSFELNPRVRFQAGIGNLFDRAPPFADLSFGYDAGYHSPKQRAYNASVTYRL
jgi:iron complex outermembrane receptor protein